MERRPQLFRGEFDSVTAIRIAEDGGTPWRIRGLGGNIDQSGCFGVLATLGRICRATDEILIQSPTRKRTGEFGFTSVDPYPLAVPHLHRHEFTLDEWFWIFPVGFCMPQIKGLHGSGARIHIEVLRVEALGDGLGEFRTDKLGERVLHRVQGPCGYGLDMSVSSIT